MTIFLVAAGIVLCLIGSAFFSASEMAYSSCSALRLENLEEEGSRPAKTARYILDHFDDTLSTILIGNNMVNIASSSLASVLLMLLLGTKAGEQYAWASTAVMTVFVIICGETIPQNYSQKECQPFCAQLCLSRTGSDDSSGTCRMDRCEADSSADAAFQRHGRGRGSGSRR